MMTTYAVTKYYSLAGQRVPMQQGAAVYYLYGDHLGSTSLLMDVGGAAVSASVSRSLPRTSPSLSLLFPS